MMNQPFPVGIFAALALCLVFFAGLVWYGRKHRKISRRLQIAIASTFVAIPMIGMVYVVMQIITTGR